MAQPITIFNLLITVMDMDMLMVVRVTVMVPVIAVAAVSFIDAMVKVIILKRSYGKYMILNWN